MLSRTAVVINVMPKYSSLRQVGLKTHPPYQANIVSKRHTTSGTGSKYKIVVETVTDAYSYLVHLIKNLQ